MRNLPLIFLAFVIAVMVVALLRIQQAPAPIVTIIPAEPAPVSPMAGYTGRMVMPSINDIYVLENTANRDLNQIAQYIQGRAAGLHWLAAEHFKAKKKSRKKPSRLQPLSSEGDILMGIKLSLDSLGQFESQILFSNVNDEALNALVQRHISQFWRYRKSAGGRFEMWAPFVWKQDWSPFVAK